MALAPRTVRTIDAMRQGSTGALAGKDEEVHENVLVTVKATDILRLVGAIDELQGKTPPAAS